MVDSINEEIEKISFAPFDAEIRGLGAFPNLRCARAIWAGIQTRKDFVHTPQLPV